MRRHASLDADQALRHIRKSCCDPAARELFAQNDCTILIEANQMEGVLACIDAYGQSPLTRGQSGRAVDIVRGPSLIRRFPAPPKFESDWRQADMQRASRARPMLCLCKKNGARAVQRYVRAINLTGSLQIEDLPPTTI
jgi:hypothetical protein